MIALCKFNIRSAMGEDGGGRFRSQAAYAWVDTHAVVTNNSIGDKIALLNIFFI